MKPALTIKPIPRLFHSTHLLRSALLLLSSATIAGSALAQTPGSQAMNKIEHVVVIYAENHSFDNLYGKFPGANGIAQATAEQKLQLDHDGQALKSLAIFDHHGKPHPQFPVLPNAPFQIDSQPVGKKLTDLTPSGVHAFFHNKEQINGGKNNKREESYPDAKDEVVEGHRRHAALSPRRQRRQRRKASRRPPARRARRSRPRSAAIHRRIRRPT